MFCLSSQGFPLSSPSLAPLSFLSPPCRFTLQCSSYVNRTWELYKEYLGDVTDVKMGYEKLLAKGFVEDIPFNASWDCINDMLDALVITSEEQALNPHLSLSPSTFSHLLSLSHPYRSTASMSTRTSSR